MNINTDHLCTDGNCVLKFLKTWPDTFVSGMEIARNADGKSRFVDDPRWAGLALAQLVDLGQVESDGHDKYRIKKCETATTGVKKRFIAPHLREILEKHGQKIGALHYSVLK